MSAQDFYTISHLSKWIYIWINGELNKLTAKQFCSLPDGTTFIVDGSHLPCTINKGKVIY